ncbi:glutaminase A [Bacillus sp. 165]|uniref:glutaminase A n=1 Tax=Bacillus sp. 165 TaxID=1529117 RepID=UPI001ADC5EEB|nr:glutaminase A [Bacillus sp. 165]MBO9130976.1 glutaminase A [Bacillus sp. 165]
MQNIVINHLESLVEQVRDYTHLGNVATYIPALSYANSQHIGIAIIDKENNLTYAGDAHVLFTLQSISKVLTLALALMDRGKEYVFGRVGMEPTGDPFNSIIKLETSNPSKPLNPMINAGALAVTNMIMGESNEEKMSRLLSFVREITDNPTISYSNEVAQSEFETAHLNRALCYYMKQNHIVEGNVEDLLDFYTKQCAIEVNCLDLSRIGLLFANGGYDPYRQKQLIPREVTRICKTFMVTCGMYNESGEFAIKVGIPAKSGVAGGILGCVKDQLGVGIFGPALDAKGNSLAGMKLLEILSEEEDWSMF